MVQDQLVDYISSQMKLGVPRDAIRSALVSAGWVAADVDDTLKKVDGAAVTKVQPTVTTSGVSVSTAKPVGMGNSFSSPSSTGMGTAGKSAEPQMIRVSDLVSSSSPMSSSSVSPAGAAKTNKDMAFGGKISGNTFQATPAKAEKSNRGVGTLVGEVVAAILILVFGGFAWYFYSANAGLAAQVKSLTSQTTSVNAQLASLKSQVGASGAQANSQAATLAAANAALALNLSFYAAPPGSNSAATSSITVSGVLSGTGKAPYALTTSYGAKIFVANSTDPQIAPELKPLVGTTVQLSGSYTPGSDELTVSSVATSTTAPTSTQ